MSNQSKISSMVKIAINFQQYPNAEALPPADYQLLLRAEQAAQKAYAPYSDFQVGAAALLQNGQIVEGANQENAAYPSGMCAERVAIFNARMHFPKEEILAIAIAAKPIKSSTFVAASPCGACRQVMSEKENEQSQPIKLIFRAEQDSVYILHAVADSLPFKFSKHNLGF